MSQSRVAHHFPPWSLRSTGFSSPVPLEHQAEHSPPWSPRSTESRAVHLFLPCTPGAPGRGPRILLHGFPGTSRRGLRLFFLPGPSGAPGRESHVSFFPDCTIFFPNCTIFLPNCTIFLPVHTISPFSSSITLVSSVTVLINVDTLVEEAADTVCNTGLDIGGVIVENDDSSDAGEGRIDRFRSDGCKCQLSGGEPCHILFTATQIWAACDKCHQLTHDQLDMVVMGQLRSSCRNDRVTLKSKENNTLRQRLMTLFHFGGHRICHTFFLFLRAMGTERFKAIKQSWLERGLCPRIALKILPHNTTIGYQMSNA